MVLAGWGKRTFDCIWVDVAIHLRRLRFLVRPRNYPATLVAVDMQANTEATKMINRYNCKEVENYVLAGRAVIRDHSPRYSALTNQLGTYSRAAHFTLHQGITRINIITQTAI